VASKFYTMLTPSSDQVMLLDLVEEGNTAIALDITSIRVFLPYLNVVELVGNLVPYMRITLSSGAGFNYGEPGFLGNVFVQPKLTLNIGGLNYYQMEGYTSKGFPETLRAVSPVSLRVEYITNTFQIAEIYVQVFYKYRNITTQEFVGLKTAGF